MCSIGSEVVGVSCATVVAVIVGVRESVTPSIDCWLPVHLFV